MEYITVKSFLKSNGLGFTNKKFEFVSLNNVGSRTFIRSALKIGLTQNLFGKYGNIYHILS